MPLRRNKRINNMMTPIPTSAELLGSLNVFRQRLLAFVISGFFCGMAGGLFGHFLGMLTVDSFYLSMTFITLAMLVVGGMQSMSGAVVGVVVISFFIEALRKLELRARIKECRGHHLDRGIPLFALEVRARVAILA